MVRCVWWDHACATSHGPATPPLFQAESTVPIESLVSSVGKHIALGHYVLAPTFCATPSTLSIVMTTAASPLTHKHHWLAFQLAVDPSFLHSCSALERSLLLETGLVKHAFDSPDHLVEISFPALDSLSPPPPTSPTLLVPPIRPADSPKLPKYESIGIMLLTVPSKDSGAPPSWSGASVGDLLGFSSQSTPSFIIAEFGRQIGPPLGLFKIISAVATGDEVTLVVEMARDGDQRAAKRREVAFQLLKGGGIPWTEGLRAQALEVGLLHGPHAS